MELASLILRKISLAADSSDNPDYFKIVDCCLNSLNRGTSNELVECWFWFNYAKALGEQINLYRDTTGEKLSPDDRYYWDVAEMSLGKKENGEIGADEIKIMRLMTSSDIGVSERIIGIGDSLSAIIRIARAVNKV
jgi:hypothetical protein